MLAGKVYGDAKTVYSHCIETLQKADNGTAPCKGDQKTVSIRQFVYVNNKEVDRKNTEKLNVVKGTRKIHSVKKH